MHCQFLNSFLVYISSCLTHRSKFLPLLHAVHVYCMLFFSIYLSSVIYCNVCSVSAKNIECDLNLSLSTFMINSYQPIPFSSVCPSLDFIPAVYFYKAHFSFTSLSLRNGDHSFIYSFYSCYFLVILSLTLVPQYLISMLPV